MMKLCILILYAIAIGGADVASVRTKLRGNPGERIIGGVVARAGQFPFSAAIYISTNSGTYFCGGALLNNDWILTSAQCVDGGVLFNIRLGTHNLEANEPDSLRLATDTYFLHPQYNPDTIEHDVGLIKFRIPILYNDYIQPVNILSEVAVPDGSSVVTVGWGQTSDETAGLSNDLHYVYLTTLSNAECRVVYGNQITENMVCVDGNYNEGTCRGDNGSPLIQYGSRAITYHVGIASFISGNGCESTDPSGYTRTNPYRDWIRNTTDAN